MCEVWFGSQRQLHHCLQSVLKFHTPLKCYVDSIGFAPDKKFHVDHFTCSACPTLFGPQDSYYEHKGDVYCHFHYSTRFATKCAGCNSAILKQFVEINRNMRDECWHPECYMINKVSWLDSFFLSMSCLEFNIGRDLVLERQSSIKKTNEHTLNRRGATRTNISRRGTERKCGLVEREASPDGATGLPYLDVCTQHSALEIRLLAHSLKAFYQRSRSPVRRASRICYDKSAMVNT